MSWLYTARINIRQAAPDIRRVVSVFVVTTVPIAWIVAAWVLLLGPATLFWALVLAGLFTWRKSLPVAEYIANGGPPPRRN